MCPHTTRTSCLPCCCTLPSLLQAGGILLLNASEDKQQASSLPTAFTPSECTLACLPSAGRRHPAAERQPGLLDQQGRAGQLQVRPFEAQFGDPALPGLLENSMVLAVSCLLFPLRLAPPARALDLSGWLSLPPGLQQRGQGGRGQERSRVPAAYGGHRPRRQGHAGG